MKNTATNKVESTCTSKSCERERISRKVHTIKLIQKMTIKATRKPTTTPSALLKVSSILPDDGVAKTTMLSIFTGTAPLSA